MKFSMLAKVAIAVIAGTSFANVADAKDKGQSLGSGGVLLGATNDQISTSNVRFVMQSDCNLVAYHGPKPVWNSGSVGKGANCRAVMQSDGNLVVYRGGDNKVVWHSGTFKYGGSTLVAQYDGNVVIYQGKVARWNTNTVIRRPSPGTSTNNSGPFAGCQFARTDTKCIGVVLIAKDVYQCGFDFWCAQPIEKSSSWYASGGCFGLPW